jgi:hypothetical protein
VNGRARPPPPPPPPPPPAGRGREGEACPTTHRLHWVGGSGAGSGLLASSWVAAAGLQGLQQCQATHQPAGVDGSRMRTALRCWGFHGDVLRIGQSMDCGAGAVFHVLLGCNSLLLLPSIQVLLCEQGCG